MDYRQIDGASKKKAAARFTVDSVAAAIVLREYLERHNAGPHGNAAQEEPK